MKLKASKGLAQEQIAKVWSIRLEPMSSGSNT